MTTRSQVEYNGTKYVLRSPDTPIPDLASMEKWAALTWLYENTDEEREVSHGRNEPFEPATR